MAHVDKNPSINPANTIAHIPVSSCQEDDRYTFKKNGELQISYGSDQCKTGEPSNKTLTTL